ncbi:MAG: NAD(P)/FAD-dependent oxidoreductase, partial [Bacteroidales bacterium]|nr:NAD(P)/FAD-dependent oxidoreductase [Bacteroidales bacterium]
MTDAALTIIGGGVVGLALAEELSGLMPDTYLIERHSTFGQETSSRSSEVIHAGIYYTKGSLKARLCIEGKKLLYEYCRKYKVPHKQCGKLIVATTPVETETISSILETARNNGVDDMELIGSDRISELEPSAFALKALLSPSTGIVDSHSLMKQYETNAVGNGCQLVYGSEVTGIKRTGEGYLVRLLEPDGNEYEFTSRVVINSAGLNSDRVAEMVGICEENLRILFCKGEYFRLLPPKNKLIGRLIYPVPHHNMEGIGIHVTVDMAGGVKLGPDVSYLPAREYDYRVTPSKQEAFWLSAKKFLPFLEYDDIAPEMAGIRPKIQRPGEAQRDYYIREESDRGLPGFINLIGMESPALTSSIAIAK